MDWIDSGVARLCRAERRRFESREGSVVAGWISRKRNVEVSGPESYEV
ncbi:MAG: hypothetical protein HFI03_11070 [Lachnospiraceae bacterium]|nr:hypothetical protein [Lachnospiraceae bacterium]